jgi:hypothetical protein
MRGEEDVACLDELRRADMAKSEAVRLRAYLNERTCILHE